MRKKAVCLLYAVLLLFLAAACEHNTGSSGGSDNSNQKSNITHSGSTTEPDRDDLGRLNFFKEGRIDALYPISKDCCYIVYFADHTYSLCVYDEAAETVKKKTVIAESDDVSKYAVVESYIQGKNICISSSEKTLSGSEIKNPRAIFSVWDPSLNQLVKMDITKIALGMADFCISPRLDHVSYLAYKDGKTRICINDRNMKNPQYPLPPDKESAPGSIQSLAFVNDTTLAFTGTVEKGTVDVFGTVTRDGAVDIQKHNDISDKICTSLNKTLFSDKHTEANIRSSGTVYLVDNKSGKISAVSLIDKNESQNAFLSDAGKYLITYQEGAQQNNHAIYRFRIYDTHTGKSVKEFTIPMDTAFGDTSIQNLYGSEEFDTLTVVYHIIGQSRVEQYALK